MYVPTLFVRERYGKSKKLLSLSIHRQMIYKYKQNFLKIALSQKHNTTIFSRSTSERYRSYYLQREAKELKQVWLISYPSLSL